MEKFQSSRRSHHLPAGANISPCLLRSKSAVSLPEPRAVPSKPNQKSGHRSKSATKTREEEEKIISKNWTAVSTKNKVAQDHSKQVSKEVHTRSRPTPPGFPSAWALSPGRSLPFPHVEKQSSPAKTNSSSSSMRGILKYFKLKKTMASQDMEYHHQYRIMQNKLLQWRFVNARAERAISTVKIVSEKKMSHSWLTILELRNLNMEKKLEINRLRSAIKLHAIIDSEIYLLEQWSKIESKHCEALRRLARKLSAMSIKIPLVNDAKGDISALHDIMNTAVGLMENIEVAINRCINEVENSCYLLTELGVVTKQVKEHLWELQYWIYMASSFKAKEKSLRAYLIQVANDLRIDDGSMGEEICTG